MDPLTTTLAVCSVARGIWTVGSSIYTFAQGAFEIDGTLESLLSELDSLSRAGHTIDECLKSPAFKKLQIENGESLVGMLKPLRASLENCKQSLERFETILNSMKSHGGKRNIIDKTKAKIQLDMKAPDIVTHRAQIASHVSTMQVAFQTINLFVTIHSSERVVQNLGPRIDRLTELLDQMPPQYTCNSWQIELSTADAARLQEGTSGLKNVAEKVISDARTILSPDRDSIHNHHDAQIPEKQRVSHWNIQTVQDVGRAARIVGNMNPHIETIPEDDDGTRIAGSRLVVFGDRDVRAGDLPGAERYYRQALERQRSSDRPSIDRYNATLKLAKVLRQQEKLQDAKEVLAPTCARPRSIRSMTVPEAEIFTEACHFLIGVLIELKELDEAKLYCERAMLVASQGYGKDSDSYRESARLLGVVLEVRDGEEDSDSPDEAAPSERITQPVQTLETTNTRRSEDSESSAEISIAALRPRADSGRPSTKGSIPQFKVISDGEDEDAKNADLLSSRSNSKSPSSSPQRAHHSLSSSATRPRSEKRNTGNTFKSATSSGSMLRHLSISTTSSAPSEPPAEKPTPTKPMQRRPTGSKSGSGKGPASVLLNELNNNAEKNVARALKALQKHPFSVATPLTFIGSSKFAPHLTLRKAIYAGLVEVVWMLLFRLSDVKATWEKLNRTMGMSMSKAKSSKFPQYIDPKYRMRMASPSWRTCA